MAAPINNVAMVQVTFPVTQKNISIDNIQWPQKKKLA